MDNLYFRMVKKDLFMLLGVWGNVLVTLTVAVFITSALIWQSIYLPCQSQRLIWKYYQRRRRSEME